MEDSLAIVFAVIVAIFIMFIFPLLDTWELQDSLSYTTTYATVTDFVDTVRNTGYISQEVYSAFENRLGMTGNSFAITMEHRKFIEDVGAYMNVYTNEIERKLDTDGVYRLDKYDYFYVTVRNTNKTQATVIREFVYANNEESFKIGTAYGGIVWAISE
ncbi:MAG: hypothetical protein IJ217_05770 [Clostridia bacterium]|nr:hypothetical protein [Clostridia bacterium]